MKNNQIQRFVLEKSNIRGELVRLTDSYQTIITQHAYPAAIGKILGEMLASACLLSAVIKSEGRLTIQFQGKEFLKFLVAQCDNEFTIRGLAQWKGNLTERKLLNALQKGTLAIIVSTETNVNSYQGIVTWQGQTLAQSIEGYFKDSVQLPTRIWLAMSEKEVAGLLLQSLPENILNSHELINPQWQFIVQSVEDEMQQDELLKTDFTTLLSRLFPQEEIRVFEPSKIQFGCNCSVEKSANAIFMLGEKEADQELINNQIVVVKCEFCNQDYKFNRTDITNIFRNNDNSSNHMH